MVRSSGAKPRWRRISVARTAAAAVPVAVAVPVAIPTAVTVF
jgi:hypothetical protein